MTRIWLNEKEYFFPESWGEIPSTTRSGVLRLVWESSKKTAKGRLGILFLLNPIPKKTFRKLVSWQIYELCSLLDWIWEQPIELRPFDYFEHNGTQYYLPGENFKNTTFGEFLNAFIYFFQLMYDEDSDREEVSSKLVATLCRPSPENMNVLSPSWSGDFREPFNEHVVEPRSKLLLDIDPGTLAGIIQYFLHELKWLYETYDVFQAASKAPVEPDPDDPENDEEPEPYDWVSTLMDMKDIKYVLVEEKLYLTPEGVMKDNLNNIFDALIRLRERDPKTPVTSNQPTQEEEYD